MEILSRTFLPIVPVEPDELARKADLGAQLSTTMPTTGQHIGALWAKPNTDEAELFVWTGTKWLPFLGAVAPPTTTLVWGDASLLWGGSETWG